MVKYIFYSKEEKNLFEKLISENELDLIKSTDEITKKMRARGGGINKIILVDKSSELNDYFQLSVDFITV